MALGVVDEVMGLIEKTGRKAVPFPGEFKEKAFCRSLVADAIAALGGLDNLVSNAARSPEPRIIDAMPRR